MILLSRALHTLIFFTLLSSCSQKETNTSQNNLTTASAIQYYAEEFLSDPRFHSVSIAIYDRGKAYTGHYGELAIGKGNLPNDNTLYELGSVSKLFTGILAAKAVLEQRITLDDDAHRFLKQNISDYSYTNLRYKNNAVLVRHLLTHTSGFPNIIPGLNSKATFFHELNKIDIGNHPGEKYLYSNTAPELMAYILETTYKRTYTELLNEFFVSLGMQNTHFRLSPSDKAQLAQGYNGKGKLMPNLNSSLWGGAVGLHSTSRDLLRFMEFHLDPTSALVTEVTRKLFTVNDNLSLGYFWQLTNNNQAVSFRHHGGIYGMQNWLMIYPEHQLGISVITNVSFNGVGVRLESLSDNLLTTILRRRESKR